MRTEVNSAVDFLTNILLGKLPPVQAGKFRQCLNRTLCSHYQNHWFPEKPFKGSGYRCIRINHKMDPLLLQAGAQIGLSERELFSLMPSELTLWVDPEEVSYRIGEDGSIGVLYDARDSTSSNDEDVDDELRSSTSSSSASSSGDENDSNSSSPTEFIQNCKEAIRYFLPDSRTEAAMNLEYLSSLVSQS